MSSVCACGLDTAPTPGVRTAEDAGSFTAPSEGTTGSDDSSHRVLEAIIVPVGVDAGVSHCGNGKLDPGEKCDPGSNDCCTDDCKGAKPKGEVCRNASGPCDVVEECDGTAVDCPDDALLSKGTECRPAAGACDVAEVCDGTSKACPDDAFKSSSVRCRDATGDCDNAENCTGDSAGCPEDGVTGTSTICRAATGDCDAVEHCDGKRKDCPSDGVADKGTVCRASPANALCDEPEVCDGDGKDCPPATTVVAAAGRPCRPAIDLCDQAEVCDGQTTQCPSDKLRAQGDHCRESIGNCDVVDVCDGQTAVCPDIVLGSSTVCRPVMNGDDCDVADHCDGISGVCPTDQVAGTNTVCRSVNAGDDCDVVDHCDGAGKACPQDAVAPNTQVCRAKNGACDVEETCNGGKRCPSDQYSTSGVCRAVNAGDDCDLPESCDGSGPNCPTDTVVSANSRQVCRAASGAVCDQAEYCSGGKKCPNDGYATGPVCNPANPADLCDAPDLCDGSSATCPPVDTRLKDGDACNSNLGACWSDICCPAKTKASATHACQLPTGHQIVFVTATATDHNGLFKGSDGDERSVADAVCNKSAKDANLAGSYHAWLSISVPGAGPPLGGASSRVGKGPFYLVDDSIAATAADLTGGSIEAPIDLTAWGQTRHTNVWTGTDAKGAASSGTCSNWSGNTNQYNGDFGDSSSATSTWTLARNANGAGGTTTCDNKLALYCFEDDCPGQAVVNFLSDPNNCGSCGNMCPNQKCARGMCQ